MRTWIPWEGYTFDNWPVRVLTQAGAMWSRLKRYEAGDPYRDEQETLFDLPPAPKQPGGRRVERMELAVRLLARGYELHAKDTYVHDVAFNRWKRVVRVATRALAEVYETAVYMGAAITSAGEIDWRSTEMTSEDFYAY